MWAVAENFLENDYYKQQTNVQYIATATNGSVVCRLWKMISGYFKILYVLCTKKIDIVHIHMAEKGSTFRKGIVILFSRIFNCKVVVQLHAGPFMSWYRTQSVLKKGIIRYILNKPDKLLVLGEYWKKEMAAIVLPEKIEVLYNGVKCPKINLYNTKAQNIVYLGVMKKGKGIYDLLDAFKLIDDKLPRECVLILAGTDPDEKVSDYIKSNDLEKQVKMLGWISGSEKEKVLREAAVLVQPSYFEGLSMSVIEAMSYGVPVIATNISTMPEVLGDEIELVAVGNKEQLASSILNYMNHVEKRLYYSTSEFSRAKKIFNINVITRRAVNIYFDLLGKRTEN
jgi:glycosyltransferase involved in cell wall biosynthesis